MLKNIIPLMLVGVLTSTDSADLAGYEEICLKNESVLGASFIVQKLSRRNARGLDKISPDKKPVTSDGPKKALKIGEEKCVSNPARKKGDRIRVTVSPAGGRAVACHSDAGQDEHLFLNPDDELGGALRFRADGAADAPSCHLTSEERMHSECNATLDGMKNVGCMQWRTAIRPGILHDIVRRKQGYGMLGDALNQGADINQPGQHGETPLHIAAQMNRAGYLTRLIARGANVRARDSRGREPLLTAVNAGHMESARKLLEAGANPDQTDDDGACPLHTAAAAGRLDIVRLLAEKGANVNAKIGDEGKNPLMIAQSRGHKKVVAYLLEFGAAWGADPQEGAKAEKTFGGGQTALHVAAKDNRADRVQRLLRDGAHLNARDDQGRTPLMLAVEKGHQDILWMLLAVGADANLPRLDGTFPLYLAAETGRRDLVRALANGRKTNLKARHPKTGKTAAEVAAALFQQNRSSAHEAIRWDLLNLAKRR